MKVYGKIDPAIAGGKKLFRKIGLQVERFRSLNYSRISWGGPPKGAALLGSKDVENLFVGKDFY